MRPPEAVKADEALPYRPPVPVLDLAPELEQLWPTVLEAMERVARSTNFIMGPDVTDFEREVAAFLGAKHAIGVNSGTDALVISLRALGLGPGDEVITTPFSFFATAEAISSVGATPVFADIEEDSFNLDPHNIEAHVNERTKALLPVHLYGRPCNMDKIMAVAQAHDLRVIEDCAQSFGATHHGTRTGMMGSVGAYSFFPSKNLGAFGDAGLIATDNDELAELARMLRAHGSKVKYQNEMIGCNSRMDSLQAAVLRVKLPYVDLWNESRRSAAANYNELFRDQAAIVTPAITDGHVFHQYTIRLMNTERDIVQAELKARGISTMVYYPVPQDRLPVYLGQQSPNPISDALSSQVLSLPIWPSISHETQKRVAHELLNIVG